MKSQILLLYFTFTSIWGCLSGAFYPTTSVNKQIVYVILGVLFGWLILPIKFFIGLYEIYEEHKNDK